MPLGCDEGAIPDVSTGLVAYAKRYIRPDTITIVVHPYPWCAMESEVVMVANLTMVVFGFLTTGRKRRAFHRGDGLGDMHDTTKTDSRALPFTIAIATTLKW